MYHTATEYRSRHFIIQFYKQNFVPKLLRNYIGEMQSTFKHQDLKNND